MKPEKFREILKAATAGSYEALERIFELYRPLIDKHSRVNGKLDEDLRQEILIHIALNISKFTI
jgi:hypothetical protein